MSDLQVIESVLERAAGRRRWQRAWRGFWWGIFVGSVIWLLTLALYKLFPFPIESLSVGAAVAVFAASAGAVAGWLRSASRLETARWMDGREMLQERLSTALEVAANPRDGRWSELVVTDAAAHARQVDPRKLLPFSLPRASRWALVALAVGAGLGFVPERRSDDYVQRQQEKANIKDTGKHLEDVTKRRLQNRKPALPQTEKAMEAVAELGQELQKKKLTRTQALADLAQVTDKLKDQTNELRKNPGVRKLQKAARQSDGEMMPSAEALEKQIESMQRELAGKDVDGKMMEKLEKMKQGMKKLKDAAGSMGKDGSAADGKASEAMSEALDELMQQAEDLGIDLAGLDEAAEALGQGEIDKFLKDMDVALLDLEKMQQFARKMSELKKQLAEVGKDLPERLAKGQGIPAIARLQKLARQLKSDKTTGEEMKQVMSEISRSIDPAMEYGKVADYVQQAATQAKAGDKKAAAQSLEQAAKELEGMLKQCADCEGMMATLQALQTAQMCIGNGQGWGQRQGPPKSGNGGSPGSGVGTWSDSSMMMDTPDVFDMWDNSGVVRPDMEGKGASDRGEGAHSDALTPTKVKGQMSPGGQMPSITLKGVSIKGTSSVAYEEAVASAQSEAQSALSQERVPRAYQGAVREYFDDL